MQRCRKQNQPVWLENWYSWGDAMLSKCLDCKYFHPELCAVNPSYRVMEAKLRSRLSEAEIQACDIGILPCQDWEPSPELEPITLEVTLTRCQWKQILRGGASIPLSLMMQIQAVVWESEEIVMISVDSSNIAAIGYSALEQVLQVDFLNGSQYRYLNVPRSVFDEFQEAESKGRFLNSEIKGQFDCERVRESPAHA